jgi:hypothetical protein
MGGDDMRRGSSFNAARLNTASNHILLSHNPLTHTYSRARDDMRRVFMHISHVTTHTSQLTRHISHVTKTINTLTPNPRTRSIPTHLNSRQPRQQRQLFPVLSLLVLLLNRLHQIAPQKPEKRVILGCP